LLPPLRFVLADRRGRTVRTGVAPLALLPKAATTVLIVAARDVLLLDAVVPPLAGVRLRQALPNIIEDQLLPDGPPPHIALGPDAVNAKKTASRRTLAAIDRGWLRYLHEAFTAAGHRKIKAVPIVDCLPMVEPSDALRDEALLAAQSAGDEAVAEAGGLGEANTARDGADTDAEKADTAALLAARREEAAEIAEANALAASATVLIVGAHAPGADYTESVIGSLSGNGGVIEPRQAPSPAAPLDLANLQVEIAVRRLPVPPVASTVPVAERLAGEGLAVPADAFVSTVAALLPGAEAARLNDVNGLRGREIYYLEGSQGELDGTLRRLGVSARPLSLVALADAARVSRFDLCQFEFASQPLSFSAGSVRRARAAVALLAASVVVAVIGLNVEWFQLTHQRDVIRTRMTELLLDAFPRTTAVLDPAAQMTRSLDTLRLSAGALSPGDFLALTNRLSMSLGAVPATAIETMDYDRQTLQLTFRADAKVDAGFRERLARNGLDGSSDGKRWSIRSAR
jgi:general secretion pathway protein L